MLLCKDCFNFLFTDFISNLPLGAFTATHKVALTIFISSQEITATVTFTDINFYGVESNLLLEEKF